MTEFTQLVKERRSASNFLPNYEISQEELDEIFGLVKLGPSAFNLQHTHYIVVTDQEVKEEIRKAANGQYKVHSASAVILVLGDKEAYKKAAEINEGLLILGILNKQEYDFAVEGTVDLYETRGPSFQRDEAIRNASLSSMLFMLAAKEKGWDTCPMIGFEEDKVKEILNISDQYEVALMITLGKEKVASRQPRGYRKPVNEFVTIV
ncbi:nitroreductase family protein [Rummeliibacillus stabekisii]|uniref:nitroreductase family protein n=1 Tax=Rummeliibacillus stabekisii TaxID=241244 RepID=UPI0011674A5C|nr:nitroreductase family protein [Rummeliibacillus stabekisii]MBB5170428.1 putative NAD(P)H nitroreductase [Rummeliibacillus stabekisii]GEL04684.1 putative NAD(P)H nitroreductase MhqN [Rummeliibacillus stabekisii]